jgi:hypothetical protein
MRSSWQPILFGTAESSTLSAEGMGVNIITTEAIRFRGGGLFAAFERRQFSHSAECPANPAC